MTRVKNGAIWTFLVLLATVLGSTTLTRAQDDRSLRPKFHYDVVVVDLPPPTSLTDNRTDHQRLAQEVSDLLNTNAAQGWQPSQVWGAGPVFVVFKKDNH